MDTGEAPGDSSTPPDSSPPDDSPAPCPTVWGTQAPSPAQIVGLLDPLVVATDAADGAALTLGAADGTVGLSGTLTATVSGGAATFDAAEATGPGLLTLTVAATECEPSLTLDPVVVGRSLRSEPVYLPGGRVGSSYTAGTAWDAVEAAALPPGLGWADGWLTGVPEIAAASTFEAAALEGEDVVRYHVQLPVFPSDDALQAAPGAASDPGPWATDSAAWVVPSIPTSSGVAHDVAVRVAYPVDGAGAVAEGPFPLIVFHHAAHSPPDLYDAYTTLHDHWASWGYLVASVDGSALVYASQSWENLTDMSRYQLGAMDLLLDESADPSSALYGRIDPDQVWVAGHSRGGGASLISLWREPSLAGALCFAQVSPLQTPSQDWDDPDGNGDRAFPARPILFLAAGDDLDEPWPLPHSAYDQTVGPTLFVVEHGTNHEWTYDEGTPGAVTSGSDISWDERHALDQAYSTAFLERFARADLRWEGALFGADALSSTLSGRGVSAVQHRSLADELTIDDFSGDADENGLGGANTSDGLTVDENAAPYTEGLEAAGRGSTQIARIDAWTQGRHLGWTEDAALRLDLTPDGEGLDLSAQRALTLRVAAPCDPPPGDCPEVDPPLEIALIDASGAERTLDATEGMGALGVVGRHYSQVILPLDAFLPVDLGAVVAVELRMSAATEPDDELWVEDVRVE